MHIPTKLKLVPIKLPRETNWEVEVLSPTHRNPIKKHVLDLIAEIESPDMVPVSAQVTQLSEEGAEVENVPSIGWRTLGYTKNPRNVVLWHKVYGVWSMDVSRYFACIAGREALETIPFIFCSEGIHLELIPHNMASNLDTCASLLRDTERYPSMLTADDIGKEYRWGNKRVIYLGTTPDSYSPEVFFSSFVQVPSLQPKAARFKLDTVGTCVLEELGPKEPLMAYLSVTTLPKIEFLFDNLSEVLTTVFKYKKAICFKTGYSTDDYHRQPLSPSGLAAIIDIPIERARTAMSDIQIHARKHNQYELKMNVPLTVNGVEYSSTLSLDELTEFIKKVWHVNKVIAAVREENMLAGFFISGL